MFPRWARDGMLEGGPGMEVTMSSVGRCLGTMEARDEGEDRCLARLTLTCHQESPKSTKIHQKPPGNTRSKGERFVSRYIANAIYCIIWKCRDIAIFRKYRDISTIFSVHDNGPVNNSH